MVDGKDLWRSSSPTPPTQAVAQDEMFLLYCYFTEIKGEEKTGRNTNFINSQQIDISSGTTATDTWASKN